MAYDIISPRTRQELLRSIQENKNFRFGAGYTDLILEFKKHPPEDLTVINLAQLNDKDFTGISRLKTELKIGTLVTASDILSNELISDRFPVLYHAANTLASNQIRNVATIGGNLCTASPSGDVACALVALNATCQILSANNKTRNIPVRDFFTGVRKTVLKKNEVLQNVSIPLDSKGKVYSDFIKVGTRQSMECSVISLAYHFLLDNKNTIKSAGIAIGSAAPAIRFAGSACDYVKDASITDIDTEKLASLILNYASPIDDIRGTAWYRKEVLFNLSKNIFENYE